MAQFALDAAVRVGMGVMDVVGAAVDMVGVWAAVEVMGIGVEVVDPETAAEVVPATVDVGGPVNQHRFRCSSAPMHGRLRTSRH